MFRGVLLVSVHDLFKLFMSGLKRGLEDWGRLVLMWSGLDFRDGEVSLKVSCGGGENRNALLFEVCLW